MSDICQQALSLRRPCDVVDPRARVEGLRVAALIMAALSLLSGSSEAVAQDGSPFAWDQPSPASRWTARVEPAPRVADPKWTATVTWVRPEPQLPMLGAPTIPRRPDAPRLPATGPRSHALEGIASYYWQDQMTASGERFDRSAMTAAHKTLPIGTRVRVTNVVNGRTVVVRINDRGPFKPGRVIDLSEAAAREIDMERVGLVPVKVEVVGQS